MMNKYLQQDAYFRYYNLKPNKNIMFLVQKMLDFLQLVLYTKTNWRKYDIFV